MSEIEELKKELEELKKEVEELKSKLVDHAEVDRRIVAAVDLLRSKNHLR